MNEIWPSIQIICEQKEFVEKAKEAISATNTELGDMTTTKNRIIKFLNARNKYELEELAVAYRKETILQVKKGADKEEFKCAASRKMPSSRADSQQVFQQNAVPT